MATQLQSRRGTTAQMNAFTGAEGEIAVNTSTDTLHVHDGSTAGGHALAKADGSNIATYAGSFTTISASGAITGNVTGNLTGSVLTAAQTNITSVGTLSSLAVTGEITANGGIALGDSDKATFGASDDLQIYHDGVHSRIVDAGTGNLSLQGNDLRIKNSDASATYIQAANGGAVTLHHNDAVTLATTSTGIDVTGTATMDGLTVDGAAVVRAGNSLTLNRTDNAIGGAMSYVAGTGFIFNDANGDGTSFNVGAANRMRIDSSGRVGIGNSSPSNLLHLHNTSGNSIIRLSGGASLGVNYGGFVNGYGVAGTGGYLDLGVIDANSFKTAIQITQQAAEIRFKNGATERMRLTGGNLLVGTTNTNPAENNVNGISLFNDGRYFAGTTSNEVMRLNRKSTDGGILIFHKDGTAKGSIGTTTSAGGSRFAIGAVGDPGIIFAGTGVFPATHITASDNVSDLGSGAYRWKNVYRAGSTYSTSDRNMKQDIRDLTDAERNVAVAAKGLLKAFRFIDRVEEEGNSANIHFGIIAQDLAAAFTAEGLDANDYQVYKAAVETDEDGNEQTRLNVCYENLLAFIIAAI